MPCGLMVIKPFINLSIINSFPELIPVLVITLFLPTFYSFRFLMKPPFCSELLTGRGLLLERARRADGLPAWGCQRATAAPAHCLAPEAIRSVLFLTGAPTPTAHPH